MKRLLSLILVVILTVVFGSALAESVEETDFTISWQDLTLGSELTADAKVDTENSEWRIAYSTAYGPGSLDGYYTVENGEVALDVTDDGGLGQFFEATWEMVEPALKEGLTAYLNKPDFTISWQDLTLGSELTADAHVDMENNEWRIAYSTAYGPGSLAGYYTVENGEVALGVTDDGGLGQFFEATWEMVEPAMKAQMTEWLASHSTNAQSSAAAETYQVTYHYNQDTYADESVSVKGGTRMVQVAELAFQHASEYHKGLWFDGWYTDAELKAPIVNKDKVSADMDLYAGWRETFTGLEAMENSPLAGGRIAVLGSSVFAADPAVGEYLAIRFDTELIKEAISGTTLCDINVKSYVSRIRDIDPNAKIDLFICQLSTNDATKELPLGAISEGTETDQFDTMTVAGALEYIISYAKQTWNCPVMLLIGSQYDSEAYAAMTELASRLQEKWGIGLIDLWNNAEINGISDELKAQYIAADGIHPTTEGYRLWWGPAMEQAVLESVTQ